MDGTVCSFDVTDVNVRLQPSPSFGVQFQWVATFQCTQMDGEEESVMMDYQWAVFCLLTPQTPHRHPLPFSLPPSSVLSRTTSPSIAGTQFTDLEHDYIIDELQW